MTAATPQAPADLALVVSTFPSLLDTRPQRNKTCATRVADAL